jgi:hypothetical protein
VETDIVTTAGAVVMLFLCYFLYDFLREDGAALQERQLTIAHLYAVPAIAWPLLVSPPYWVVVVVQVAVGAVRTTGLSLPNVEVCAPTPHRHFSQHTPPAPTHTAIPIAATPPPRRASPSLPRSTHGGDEVESAFLRSTAGEDDDAEAAFLQGLSSTEGEWLQSNAVSAVEKRPHAGVATGAVHGTHMHF